MCRRFFRRIIWYNALYLLVGGLVNTGVCAVAALCSDDCSWGCLDEIPALAPNTKTFNLHCHSEQYCILVFTPPTQDNRALQDHRDMGKVNL